MVEYSDGSADPDHGENRTDSYADQMPGEDKTENNGDRDIRKVKAVFREAHAFVIGRNHLSRVSHGKGGI